ncbi:protein kinase domain-containing protein [Nocardiopsis composta]|uniref:mitogen-activated protein kinase kinase n=1 Tax=Nocardiopsis composta TaxID=157465 RepID=A0A7W8QSP4_9ACTN|nr:serine/threonine protein kinase [Nocardiopsis composta]MBB5435766.1 serine/threonine protein kinase [Nocardiopsis composta]
MADPQQSDPVRPSDPAAPTTRLDPGQGGAPGRTHRITRVLRPREGEEERTGVLPAPQQTARIDRTRTAPRPLDATAVHRPGPQPWWRRAYGTVTGLPARLVTRAVVGPAGELDYAVPAEVRERYTVLGHIGSGGEAVVYLAEPKGAGGGTGEGGGTRLALKVYRPGHDINRELLERLRARGEADPHTPAIHGYGHARSAWGEEVAWEAQEYFPDGSLRSVLDRAPLPEEEARAVLAGVAECLHHWQTELQHNHTDVKPENLLVRSADPPAYALTDFGGAVRATMSRIYGRLAITEEYAAPEVVEGRREAPAAWWSLGVIVHEMAAGRRPPRGENWLTARSAEIDVSAVADERWRLLARGLLAPVPDERWGYDQVRQWLDGETPVVARARRNAPITFADAVHHDPPSLAFDLLDRSDKGEVWLRTHWSSLRTWLDREVNDYTFDRSLLTALQDRPELAQTAISALAAHFIPGMTPRFRGHDVSAEGVLALATGERSRHGVLREAVQSGALEYAARHWCDHPGCHDDGARRCALLERVQHEVPLVMEEAEATVRRLTREGAGDFSGVGGHVWDGAWAHAAELVLDPEAAPRERRALRTQAWNPVQRGPARHAEWWRAQRRAALRGAAGEIATNAALVMVALLMPVATAVGAETRRREIAEGRDRRRARWEGARAKAGTALTHVRERLPNGGADRPEDAGDQQRPPNAPYDPLAARRPQTALPRTGEQRKVDRGMRQIERAMTAGRCRRFAYPAALLGLVDGAGRSMLPPEGFFPESPGVLGAYQGLLDFRESPPVSAVADAASGLTGLLPADAASQWWLPVLLGAVLILLGRTAASRKRKARTQLAAYRLSVAGSVAMAVVLLANGLLTLGAGVLIPLDALLG